MEFVDRDMSESTAMKEIGYIFVPHVCKEKDKKCNVHFSMHSCGANSYDAQVIGYGEYYGRYAASNNLVMVYFFSNDKDNCHDTRG